MDFKPDSPDFAILLARAFERLSIHQDAGKFMKFATTASWVTWRSLSAVVKREVTNVIPNSGQPLRPEVERTCDLPGAFLHRGGGAADLDVGVGRSGQASPAEDLAERPAR